MFKDFEPNDLIMLALGAMLSLTVRVPASHGSLHDQALGGVKSRAGVLGGETVLLDFHKDTQYSPT